MNSSQKKRSTSVPLRHLDCAAIRELLTDYLARELGDARSALVREHLLKCPECQTAARDMRSTLQLLHEGDAAKYAPTTLSHDRRKRLRRAIMHPFIEYVYRRHGYMSFILTLLFLLLLILLFNRITLWTEESEEKHKTRYPSVALFGAASNILVNPPAVTEPHPPFPGTYATNAPAMDAAPKKTPAEY